MILPPVVLALAGGAHVLGRTALRNEPRRGELAVIESFDRPRARYQCIGRQRWGARSVGHGRVGAPVYRAGDLVIELEYIEDVPEEPIRDSVLLRAGGNEVGKVLRGFEPELNDEYHLVDSQGRERHRVHRIERWYGDPAVAVDEERGAFAVLQLQVVLCDLVPLALG